MKFPKSIIWIKEILTNPSDELYDRLDEEVKTKSDVHLVKLSVCFTYSLLDYKEETKKADKIFIKTLLKFSTIMQCAFIIAIDTFDRLSRDYRYVCNLHHRAISDKDYKEKFYMKLAELLHANSEDRMYKIAEGLSIVILLKYASDEKIEYIRRRFKMQGLT